MVLHAKTVTGEDIILNPMPTCQCLAGPCPIWLLSSEDRQRVFGPYSAKEETGTVECSFILTVREPDSGQTAAFLSSAVR